MSKDTICSIPLQNPPEDENTCGEDPPNPFDLDIFDEAQAMLAFMLLVDIGEEAQALSERQHYGKYLILRHIEERFDEVPPEGWKP